MSIYSCEKIPKGLWRWRYFTPGEIACRGTGTVKLTKESQDALDRLDRLRERMGHPLIVTSGYRSAEHNRRVGGATNSLHMRGIAFDISMANVDPFRFEREARALGFNGIGLYPPQKPTGGRNFIHIDMRATPWRGAQWGEFPKTGSRHTPEPEYRPVQEVTSHAAPVVGIGGLVEGALIALEPAMRELAPWLPERLQGVAIMSAVIIGSSVAIWRLTHRRNAGES
jgi:zinc D-Ala-D-Ala carboxypeptidase